MDPMKANSGVTWSQRAGRWMKRPGGRNVQEEPRNSGWRALPMSPMSWNRGSQDAIRTAPCHVPMGQWPCNGGRKRSGGAGRGSLRWSQTPLKENPVWSAERCFLHKKGLPTTLKWGGNKHDISPTFGGHPIGRSADQASQPTDRVVPKCKVCLLSKRISERKMGKKYVYTYVRSHILINLFQ
jgi:hypothetical protein